MNLHGIAGPIVGAVNPPTPAVLQISSGAVTDAAGVRAPSYLQPVWNVFAQVQPMTFRDLAQVDGLDLQGTRVSIYVSGEVDAIVRVTKKGGDLITIDRGPHKGVYLTVLVLEQWQDWVKFAATLQTDPTVIR
jgi:hypothetical protein